jgi:hypothetical protein
MKGGIDKPVSASVEGVPLPAEPVPSLVNEPAGESCGDVGPTGDPEPELLDDAGVVIELAGVLAEELELRAGVVVGLPLDFGADVAVVGAAVVGAEPGLGTKVPVKCHWPVKLLNGPPTI